MEAKDNPRAIPDGRTEVTWSLSFCIGIAVLGMFQFGYNTGVINAPQAEITQFYNSTFYSRYGRSLESSLLWSTTVAIFAVGGMMGGLLGGWWSERLGRKLGMWWNGISGIVAALLMGLSKVAESFEMVIIGRIIIGFNCGLYTALCPLYNAEVSPIGVRGAIGTINQLAVTIGILLSQALGIDKILGSEQLWPLLLALGGVASLIQMILIPFISETPRYLLFNEDKEEDAADALRKLRNTDIIDSELEEMKKEKNMDHEESMSMLQLLKMQSLRRPVLVTAMMHLSQQFSGINCIFYYSTDLFLAVGVSESVAQYSTILVGVIMVVMTLVSIPLMDRWGRRPLHIGGLSGMLIFSLLFTLTYALAVNFSSTLWLQYAAIVCALLVVVCFGIGPGSIPWMIIAEFFSQGPRDAAVSLGVLINWSANFVVGLSFPPLQEALGEYVFLPYSGLLVIFIVYLYKEMPETKGRSFDEIEASFGRKLEPNLKSYRQRTPSD